jgi:hypothetical protein
LQERLVLDEFAHAFDADSVEKNARCFDCLEVGTMDGFGVEKCVAYEHAQLLALVEATPSVD